MMSFFKSGLYAILFLMVSCSIPKEKIIQNLNKNLEMISIESYTRGANERIYVENKNLEKFRFKKKIFYKKLDSEEWNTLLLKVSKLNFEELNSIQIKSYKHQVDADWAEFLTIEMNENTYRTPTYDAGNPPEEIIELVTYVKSISSGK